MNDVFVSWLEIEVPRRPQTNLPLQLNLFLGMIGIKIGNPMLNISHQLPKLLPNFLLVLPTIDDSNDFVEVLRKLTEFWVVFVGGFDECVGDLVDEGWGCG